MALGAASPTWGGGGTRSLLGSDKGSSRQYIANTQYPQGQTANNVANPYSNAAATAMNTYGILYGPDLVGAQNQKDRIGAQGAFNDAYYDQERGYANQDYNLKNRSIGLQEEGLGVDRGANQRNAAYYQNMLNSLAQKRDIIGMDFTNTRQGLQDAAATNVRNINSESTGQGNWLLGGRANKVGDTFKKYDTELQSAELNRRQGILGNTESQWGLEKQLAETGDQDKKLDILGKGFGLDREKAKLALDQGISQLGYSQYTTGQQLLNDLDSADARKADAARKILMSVMQAGVSFTSGQMGDLYNSFTG